MSSDRSCQNSVNQAAVNRVLGGLPKVSTHTGGYCRARNRLPTQMVSTLTRKLGQSINTSSNWELRGPIVILALNLIKGHYSHSIDLPIWS